MDDWERQKNRRDLLRRNKQPPPAQEGTVGNEPDSTPVHSDLHKIYIELQCKSEFLNSRPDIDPAEVVPFTSSQLSQFPPSDSDGKLPPSQFFIVSSQPSQDIVITNPQPLSTGATESQQAGPCLKLQGISQTTIPDSQDFSTDLSQDPIAVPCTIESIHQTAVDSTKESHHTVSASSIPSRQPDGNLVSFGNFSISTDLDQNQDSQGNLPVTQPIPNFLPTSVPESSRIVFNDFLTQLEFESDEFSLSAKSRRRSLPDETVATTEDRFGPITVQDPALDDSHQPAQRVLPLHGDEEDESYLLTQSESAYLAASGQYTSVPPTSQRNSGASEQRLVPSQHAILSATHSRITLHPPIVSLDYTSCLLTLL